MKVPEDTMVEIVEVAQRYARPAPSLTSDVSDAVVADEIRLSTSKRVQTIGREEM